MSALASIVATAVLLGCALMAGVFFAFSSFVMKALARAPAAQGIAVMQTVNIVVLNPSFLLAFMGTAVLSLALGVLALSNWDDPTAPFFLAGAICYLAGTFLVTMGGNVPLNDRLAAVTANDDAARAVWSHYLKRWTQWNHVRTAAATAAVLLCAVGLTQTGVT